MEPIAHGDGAPIPEDVTELRRRIGSLEHRLHALQEQLRYRIAFEATIAAISRRFIDAADGEISGATTEALRQLGEFLEADCGSIRLTVDGGPEESFLWPAVGREPSGLPIALGSKSRQQASRTSASAPTDVPDRRMDAVAYTSNATSVLVVPLVYAGTTVGFLSFTSVPKNRNWSDETESLLGVAGEIFTAAMMRKRGKEEHDRMASQLARVERLDSIGVLAGGIAHDFNNLLAAVLGNVSLATNQLESSGPSAPLLRLREAEKALEGARGLTRQLLTFAKGGRPVKNLVDLGKLVIEAASFVTRGSNLRPDFRIACDLRPVDADAGQLAQVIHNLVINAVQATPGGGTVDIHAENLAIRPENAVPLPPGDYVRITVTDHGTGIASDHLPNLFDPYFTTKPDGTGLGLATSFSIVRQHDGIIIVDSKVGAGSQFHVYLPAATRVATSGPRAARTPEHGEGLVLVVDDDDGVRSCAEAMLAHLGYQTITASSGEQALAIYRRAFDEGKRFRAIIMDLTMPGGMDGDETFQRILAIDPEATAIVSSGYSDSPIMADHTRHGYRGVLVKPYDLRALAEALHGVLEESYLPP